jgi:alpha/beta hydrolase fold
LDTGLVAAFLLAGAPFIPAEEPAVTGAVLCGFALGWAMLAVLSVRFTDQPQRWAAAPALFMGLGGLLLVGFGSPVQQVLNWVWPPAMLALAVWMIVRVHRQLQSRVGRWLLYPVIAVLALASIGGGYETLGAAADAKAYPMPGQLIDVGGHRLHLSCTGAGTPTVVLEPGAGGMSSSLGWIAPAVARDTRVCVYDRAGRGWSEPADTAQDGAQIATDLHTLLQRGDVPRPYVLAGHSFGGLYVLTFAARYPDEVAGMVLVDSTAPASAASAGTPSPGGGSNDGMSRVSALVSTSARLGLGRLYGQFALGSLPPRSRDEVRASVAAPSTLRSTIDESTSRRRPRSSKLPPSVTSPTSR